MFCVIMMSLKLFQTTLYFKLRISVKMPEEQDKLDEDYLFSCLSPCVLYSRLHSHVNIHAFTPLINIWPHLNSRIKTTFHAFTFIY